MSVNSFNDLKSHVGHDIECVTYGDEDDPANIALECTTCCVVLVDYNNPDHEE